MKNQEYKPPVESTKIASIIILFITSIGIILLGAAFSVYSIVNNVSFSVMSSQIHGMVFGIVIVFLGVRYLLSVQRLKAEVYKGTSRFSWSNFKTEKVHKSQPVHR
ncbi:MAG: hypothetical protein WCG21_06860 [Eubacteriales bacterium]